MSAARAAPQPTRYAIQKARGKGWKTLEVGEELAHAKARFDTMVGVNPRAYFRLIQLDYNAESGYEGMEFNWTLIELHDPNRAGAGAKPGPRRPAPKPGRGAAARNPAPAKRKAKGSERVGLPLRIYLAVILIGVLVGGLAYLQLATPGR
ncbi:hypothetical protein [Azospirillum doebereinerae]|uniref:Uncharacterized protein n=1 Tax=Azospirillum doebereinerae TaxID=92933 RepID=A0A433J0G9_9PROT|nr:hypothetical protein [Azospirillum doebereinerae]MCG5244255.1 hypothetical protein [Azospirillum doebereinerae]RUQ62503.1 hypothetical protein EJ913_28575 [Azospirillum doebereinerae]